MQWALCFGIFSLFQQALSILSTYFNWAFQREWDQSSVLRWAYTGGEGFPLLSSSWSHWVAHAEAGWMSASWASGGDETWEWWDKLFQIQELFVTFKNEFEVFHTKNHVFQLRISMLPLFPSTMFPVLGQDMENHPTFHTSFTVLFSTKSPSLGSWITLVAVHPGPLWMQHLIICLHPPWLLSKENQWKTLQTGFYPHRSQSSRYSRFPFCCNILIFKMQSELLLNGH